MMIVIVFSSLSWSYSILAEERLFEGGKSSSENVSLRFSTLLVLLCTPLGSCNDFFCSLNYKSELLKAISHFQLKNYDTGFKLIYNFFYLPFLHTWASFKSYFPALPYKSKDKMHYVAENWGFVMILWHQKNRSLGKTQTVMRILIKVQDLSVSYFRSISLLIYPN